MNAKQVKFVNKPFQKTKKIQPLLFALLLALRLDVEPRGVSTVQKYTGILNPYIQSNGKGWKADIGWSVWTFYTCNNLIFKKPQ